MLDESLRPVFSAYRGDLAPSHIESVGGAGGFSGALLWRLETDRGPACLRRWPAEHPPQDRLEFIQAVLWHVNQEGFDLVPVPFETKSHAGYVHHAGHFWEITPWMPGCADFHCLPCPAKLRSAMTALARFHLAAESFPLPSGDHAPAPGIVSRVSRLRALGTGGLQQIAANIRPDDWPELVPVAHRLCELFSIASVRVLHELEPAAQVAVKIQPCIRDIWHDHVLFSGGEVTGIVDFGAMRPESVAADVARLLGSLVTDDLVMWHVGLSAYQSVRPLSAAESQLITAFDRSTVLMSGLQWLEWIYLEGRTFPDREAVWCRLQEIMLRLEHLARSQR